VAGGGRLLIEGTSIGTDWSGSAFYEEVCHAESSGAAPILDLEVADGDHPLAAGFNKGEIIEIAATFAYSFTPDIVQGTEEAEVVFVRGPASEGAGMHTILAWQGVQARVVYLTFPIYLLPPEVQDIVILNAAKWLLE
jgi:hypothetical protein